MKKLISISEIVERIEMDDSLVDVCAIADAAYDDVRGLVEVKLSCSAVRGDIRPGPAPPPPEWLPHATVIREAVPLEEASEEARSIFAHWVKQVRHAIPSAVNV
ncbi:MAG: hypothetical protein HY300_10690 [Verrucomicrobia bacterium]|nr:hypothetical protein [Verrucomicrobiota bacterium]